jgi:hypothetical protein
MPRKNSPITNTNTNINKININIPKTITQRKPRQGKQTQEQVNSAEEKLSNLENMDSQFVNPSVFGFNRTPLYIPEPIQQVQNRIIEQPAPIGQSRVSRTTQTSPMQEEEEFSYSQSQPTSPINFSSASPVQAEIFRPRPVSVPTDKSGFESMGRGLQLPSDFQARLSRQEGFQPVQPMSSPFSMYQNPNLASAILRRTSMTSGPDINELRTRMFAVKQAGVSSSKPLLITEGTSPMPEPAKKKGGRPKGTKNKPKPVSTGVGTSAPAEPLQTVEVTQPITTVKLTKAQKTALRALQQKPEELD